MAGVGLDSSAGPKSAYEEKFAQSETLFRRARNVIAGGISHDSWYISPFPVYIDHASGPAKWDVSGSRFIDYWMGHGSLLFGHCFPPVVEAIVRQVSRGSHYGAAQELEVRWAELVCKLIPSADRVRFTSSGTEAVMLSLRIARAFTGRYIVLKLNGNFHGWHDEAMSHFVPAEAAGLSPGSEEYVGLADPRSIDSIADFLKQYEVAAIILEPGGGSSGALPYDPAFLQELRQLTALHECLLIFDEVVSGFRYSPGGVQQLCGVMPDITVLAKILCGGLPGGAVAGREEVMSVFGDGALLHDRRAKVPHTGTFNGNPLSAAAGVSMLEHVRDNGPQQKAQATAERLVSLVNQASESHGVDVHLYSNSSIFHILIGAKKLGAPLGPSTTIVSLLPAHQELYSKLRKRLLLEGVDLHPAHGWVSAAHDGEVQATAEAFDRAFRALRDKEGFRL